jgi:hypothetical protein
LIGGQIREPIEIDRNLLVELLLVVVHHGTPWKVPWAR